MDMLEGGWEVIKSYTVAAMYRQGEEKGEGSEDKRFIEEVVEVYVGGRRGDGGLGHYSHIPWGYCLHLFILRNSRCLEFRGGRGRGRGRG